jgi:DHA2 family multidrug resistance protein
MVTGMAQLVAAPAAAWLQARIPGNRGNVLVAMAGFVCFALGAVLNADQSVTTDFWALLAPQLLRGVAVMFCLLPITAMALDHQPPDDLGSASALFNLLRNLGGAVGIAVVATLVEERPRVYGQRFVALLQAGDRSTAQFLGLPLDRFHGIPIGPVDQATQDMVRPVIEQGAAAAAFNEGWLVIAACFLAAALMLALAALKARRDRSLASS